MHTTLIWKEQVTVSPGEYRCFGLNQCMAVIVEIQRLEAGCQTRGHLKMPMCVH